jgi:hypothetical protein
MSKQQDNENPNVVTVHGTRVELREHLQASKAWPLIPIMQKVERQRTKLVSEALGCEPDSERLSNYDDPEVIAATAGVLLTDMFGVLTFDEVVKLVQAVVFKWDFKANVNNPDTWDDFEVLSELLPLAFLARQRFYAARPVSLGE